MQTGYITLTGFHTAFSACGPFCTALTVYSRHCRSF